jgi:hypothetical protein
MFAAARLYKTAYFGQKPEWIGLWQRMTSDTHDGVYYFASVVATRFQSAYPETVMTPSPGRCVNHPSS